MRFGTRSRGTDSERFELVDEKGAGVMQVADESVVTSERLQRVAAYFQEHATLLREMATQIDGETSTLAELLQHQDATMQIMLNNLEDRLRPLKDYADHEEANLQALEDRMGSEGMDYIQRSFAEYVEAQRRRIAETREQIDEQRDPFLDFRDDLRESVEVALSRFDENMDELESNLAAQRNVLAGMLETMRSEGFASVIDFLAARQQRLLDMVEREITDPGVVASELQVVGQEFDGTAAGGELAGLLDATGAADARLMASATAAIPMPRALRRRPALEPGGEELPLEDSVVGAPTDAANAATEAEAAERTTA